MNECIINFEHSILMFKFNDLIPSGIEFTCLGFFKYEEQAGHVNINVVKRAKLAILTFVSTNLRNKRYIF